MDTLQIVALVIVVVACGVGLVVYYINAKAKADEQGEKVDVQSLLYTYLDDIIRAAKDVIIIMEMKEDDYESKEAYETALLEIIAARIEKIIYDDMEVDEQFKQLVNKETILEPLRTIYHLYESLIGEKVTAERLMLEGIPEEKE